MTTFDTLIDDLAGRYGLGANARPFVKELLTMISSSPGGLGGFLDRLKTHGLASEVASWLGRPEATPLSAQQVDRALGSAALGGLAGRLGLTQGVVATAAGYALPKIVGLLTPGGVVTAGVPAEVTRFLSQAPDATLTPRRVDAPPSPTPEQSSVTRWLWPALAALVVVGLLSYFWSTLNRIPSAPPVAKAPEPPTVAQAPPPPPPPPPAAQAPASTETQATPPPPPAPPAAPEAQATAPQPPACAAGFDGNAGDASSSAGAPRRHRSTSDSAAAFASAGGGKPRRPCVACDDRAGARNPGAAYDNSRGACSGGSRESCNG